MPKKHNTLFDSNDLNHRMMSAMIMDSSVGDVPTPQRLQEGQRIGMFQAASGGATRFSSTDPDSLQEHLNSFIEENVKNLKKYKAVPKKGVILAVDMHLISRYGQEPGDEIVGS